MLDLACGDGGLGEALIARGLRYRGVDSTPEMVEAARARLGPRATVELGDLNEYAPSSPVAATTVFRAIYYARDRRAFFAHVRRVHAARSSCSTSTRVSTALDDVARGSARAPASRTVELRPFFVPQTVSLPGPVLAAAKALERSGPLARLALRARFTYLVAASR